LIRTLLAAAGSNSSLIHAQPCLVIGASPKATPFDGAVAREERPDAALCYFFASRATMIEAQRNGRRRRGSEVTSEVRNSFRSGAPLLRRVIGPRILRLSNVEMNLEAGPLQRQHGVDVGDRQLPTIARRCDHDVGAVGQRSLSARSLLRLSVICAIASRYRNGERSQMFAATMSDYDGGRRPVSWSRIRYRESRCRHSRRWR
jgi:hypothetical protein